jgi:hypothetical protein
VNSAAFLICCDAPSSLSIEIGRGHQAVPILPSNAGRSIDGLDEREDCAGPFQGVAHMCLDVRCGWALAGSWELILAEGRRRLARSARAWKPVDDQL